MNRRVIASVTLVTTLVTLAGGCGGDEGGKAKVTAGPTPSATTTPSWQTKYTSAELKEYDAAITFWRKYERAAASFWAAGKATSQARAMFNKYMTPLNAKSIYGDLDYLARQEATIDGLPKVLASRATVITPDRVYVSQCVDYSSVKFMIAGSAATLPFSGPVTRSFGVTSQSGQQRIAFLSDPTIFKTEATPCSAGS